ncbi:Eco57I restriction-modification methylase domain-containing protein [Halocatena pleomorpha]|uniref:site-specific DNA-methyltransferase (adenine-specific) n=1 Tax=Halocatena pleomorpha TaxID=1785090 RepID=A0A3P3R5H4_9EURY|nr:N-6 DNA methylase [Halocatena pleomorpha]RRJ28727.1 class I SAM-dependent DNA methyltransferase [Halocatena pleomorpha]
MQTTLTYRTNRDLFSNYYLDEHLPETEAWDEISEEELQEAYDDIMGLWESEKSTAPKRNESQLEEKFIRPMFRKLGIPFEVEESTSRTQRRPDYGFFKTEEAARDSFERREEGGDFYKNAVAVADAKRWGRPLDTRGSGEHDRDFENPSYQIHVYLQETPARWAVLTDGKKWRLYYGPTSHRLDSYYEVDLPTILKSGDLADFKYFYLFFRHEAFLEDASGDCFLDDVYGESNVFAQELGEDLQDNIYEAIKILSEGFLQYPDNDLNEDDLELIHDSSLIYLYRLIFVLYAEAEGRKLLDTSNEIYEQSYSLNSLKQEVAEELDSGNPRYRDWQDNLWDQLDELFKLIDQGSNSRGIPEKDLYIPAYNGGLFRTDPDEDDSREARFLATHNVGDVYLARVIELLTRSRNDNGDGKIFVDYSSLDVRHLGSIYEGLLEYKLNVADESLALYDGEYESAGKGDDIVIEEGGVYLTTDSGERKSTGSYYTPEHVVEYIVENTLEPLVEDIREDLIGYDSYSDGGFAEEFADRVFDLKILDPAMGSGHFLTSAVDYLAREIIDAQEKQAAQQGIETVDEEHDINWARRKVAQLCIYGVDLNPLAVELAKVSLWLRTLAAEQPLAFLDHHLKTGNSLVGSDIEDVLSNSDDTTEEGQLTLKQSFAHTRQRALEHVTDQFQSLLSIDNETLADVKEMEAVFEDVRDDPLYQHLLAMANVHTADEFGLDVPEDAYERMATALRDDSWREIESQDWFERAQMVAAEEGFFHWELEFPVAFYGEDGDREEEAGFDAVIGNPPYMRIQTIQSTDPTIAEYYSKIYNSSTGNYDIYVIFTEGGYDLLKESGLLGYIEPHKFFRGEFGQGLRQYIADEKALHQIISFGHEQVWNQVSVYTCILTLRKSANNSFQYAEVDPDQMTKQSIEFRDIESTYSSESWVFHTKNVTETLESIENAGPTLGELTEVFVGLQTSADQVYLLERTGNKTKDGLIEVVDQFDGDTWQLEPELLKPYLKGEDVHRYEPLEPRYWVIFPYNISGNTATFVKEDELQTTYPHIYEYLQEHEGELRGREGGKMDHERWYDYVYPKNLTKFKREKIVTPEISYGPNFTYDPGDTYHKTKVYGILLKDSTNISLEYLLSVLNSPVLWFFLSNTGYTLRGGYFTFKRNYLNPFSIPRVSDAGDPFEVERLQDWYEEYIDGGEMSSCPLISENLRGGTIHDFLSWLASEMIKYKKKKNSLNLSLLNYLGNYNEGLTLPDIGLFQPTTQDILNTTTEEYEKLRVGSVRTEHDKSTITIYATARYKPEDEDDFKTDQWGYTETDYLEAFSLTDLSENEATLINAFVPVAVEKGGGFADFRENATKTNSIIDRLKAITLPELNDVAADLDRYIQVKERTDELDAKIEKTDQLIDEIVYDLYDLTDEEIELVESAVQDD